MKKFIRTTVCAGVITAMFAAFQITAMAAINSASSDVASLRDIAPYDASSDVASSRTDLLRDEVSTNDITPITNGENVPNPHTGAESMVIPGAVALIAAATAAITLTGKKK